MQFWVIVSLLVTLVLGAAALLIQGTKGWVGLIWLALVVSVAVFLTLFTVLVARAIASEHRERVRRELAHRDRGESEASGSSAGPRQ